MIRAPYTLALLAAGLGYAGVANARADCDDKPCSSPCETSKVVTACAPNVVVEVPPPNVVIRAAGVECCKESFFQRCCHHCRPVYVQPVAPAYAFSPVAAPMAYQAAPMAYQAAPMTYQAAPVAYQAAPVAYQAAPMTYQAAPMAAPVSYAAAPISLQAAPISFQAAPVAAAPITLQLAAPVAPAPPAPTPAPTTSSNTMDVNEALRKVTKQVETLTAAIDQHSDYLTVHEKRLQRIENYLNSKDATGFPPITDLKALDEAIKPMKKPGGS